MYMIPPHLPLKRTHRSLTPLSYLLQEELVCSLPDVIFIFNMSNCSDAASLHFITLVSHTTQPFQLHLTPVLLPLRDWTSILYLGAGSPVCSGSSFQPQLQSVCLPQGKDCHQLTRGHTPNHTDKQLCQYPHYKLNSFKKLYMYKKSHFNFLFGTSSDEHTGENHSILKW